jgi:hypothetical protein
MPTEICDTGGGVRCQEGYYHGWPRAVEIRSDGARLVVVPEVGRILHYGFTDGRNVLYEDAALAGRRLPEPVTFYEEQGKPVWLNFGGDKVWPTEQSHWAETNGVDWPPDPWFDGGAHTARLLPDGVELTSGVSRFNGARIIRTIRLAPEGTRVTIGQRIEKVGAGMHPTAEPIPFTIWSVTQIRPPQEVWLPLRSGSPYPGRWHDYRMDNRACAREVEIAGDMAIFRPVSGPLQKIGVDAEPWLAGVVEETILVQRFRRDPHGTFPDGGLCATVFACPSYVELELMSPLRPLAVGEALEFPITWELYPLPPGGRTGAARCVAELLRG